MRSGSRARVLLAALVALVCLLVPSVAHAAEATQEMYRLYNRYTGEHFYTASASERDSLVGVGWTSEGTGWIAPKSSKTPVYRLYNHYTPGGDHHYTTNASERDSLVKVGWTYEGVGWYSDDAKGTPLYRQYNPYATTGTHNYTADKNENNQLVKLGWRPEGIAWYGVSGSGQKTYYTVEFVTPDEGGAHLTDESLGKQRVPAGGSASVPGIEFNLKAFRFDGWSATPTNVRSDMVITARYTDLYAVWRASWISENLSASMSDYDKVVAIAKMIADDFEYGGWSSGRNLYAEGAGSCLGGAYMLNDFCADLGIKAEVRFAGNDIEDYNINYGQMSGHYNNFVWIDGVQYLADTTPGRYSDVFEWRPSDWLAARDITEGKIAIDEGPMNQPIDYREGDSAVNVSIGLETNRISLPASAAGTCSLYFSCAAGGNNEIHLVSIGNENVLKAGVGYGWGQYVDIVGKGSTTLIVEISNDLPINKGKTYRFTYTVTVG